MTIYVFWDVKQCELLNYYRFLQGGWISSDNDVLFMFTHHVPVICRMISLDSNVRDLFYRLSQRSHVCGVVWIYYTNTSEFLHARGTVFLSLRTISAADRVLATSLCRVSQWIASLAVLTCLARFSVRSHEVEVFGWQTSDWPVRASQKRSPHGHESCFVASWSL
jgi:hypothetical protein